MARPWLTRRSLVLHAVLLVLLPAFAALTWWQLHRALGGNTLSWAYTFEWPLFAGYAVRVWWHLVREPVEQQRFGNRLGGAQDAGTPEPTPEQQAAQARLQAEEEADPELAAYNDYLAALARAGERRRR